MTQKSSNTELRRSLALALAVMTLAAPIGATCRVAAAAG